MAARISFFPLSLFFFCLFFVSLHSDEETSTRARIPDLPTSFSEGLPSSTVGECVDAITGLYFDHQVDLTLPGPETLTVERTYVSTNDDWIQNHYSYLYFNFAQKSLTSKYLEPTGSTLYCYGKDPRKAKWITMKVDFTKNKGLTNCGRGAISGQTHLKNVEVYFHTSGEKKRATATDGSGEERTFKEVEGIPYYYNLEFIRKPTGNVFLYKDKRVSKKLEVESALTAEVHAISPKNRVVFGYLNFNHLKEKEFRKNPSLTISASDGRKVTYKYILFKNIKKAEPCCYLSEVQRPDAPPEKYEYTQLPKSNAALLTSKKLPEGRFLNIQYEEEEQKNPNTYRKVKTLRGPLGSDETPLIAYQFSYTRYPDNSGYTDVTNAANVVTRYCFSNEQRLTRIVHYSNYIPQIIQNYHWITSGTHIGNLLSSNIMDGDGYVHYAHGYQYDEAGNVLVDTLKGNLTGKQTHYPVVAADGSFPNDNSEAYQLQYTYNAHHQVLSMTEGDQVQTLLSYYPETRLLSSKLLVEKGRIRLREFYVYDSNATLIKQVVDDGSKPQVEDLTGVTERHITLITPKAAPPCMGLPESEEQRYLDLTTQQEKLLSRTTFHYSLEGNLLRQDIYDAEGVFRYSLHFEYDALGNCTKETDALGQSTVRRYDANGNCTFEQGPRGDSYQVHTYDFMNRLIKTDEVWGQAHFVTDHRYNTLGQKISTNDLFGNDTLYQYDDRGYLVTITLPPTADEQGVLVTPTQKMAYNLLGQCTHTYDAKGQLTATSRTIRGKPHLIQYPDGTQETNTYSLSGLLLENSSRTGIITRYTYDYQKRPLTEATHTPEGQQLTLQTFVYDAFHLLQSTDAEGLVTKYTYDSAGREIAVEKGSSRTTYEYDLLGRVEKTKEWINENEYSCKVLSYDLLDRVIEETLTDQSGKIFKKTSYVYDASDNQTQVIQSTQNGLAITTTEYTPFKQPLKITDPQGNVTHFHYKHNYRNPLKQKVLQKTLIDPLGRQTLITYDTHGRISVEEKMDPLGNLIAKQQNYYDILGNKVRVIDTLYPQKQEILTLYEYDSANRLLSLTEAAGTPEQKVTTYTYNRYGQKEAMRKPDGVLLHYTYDALGRLHRVYSSGSEEEAAIDYEYHYNRNHQLLTVHDKKQQQKTERQYDTQGQLTAELLGNGQQLRYTYDRGGRVTLLTLPDNSTIQYTYDAHFLRKVQRGPWTHHYLEYDQAGNPLEAQLPGNAGKLLHEVDLLSRTKALISDQWQERDITYDAVGNLTSLEYQDSAGVVPCTFAYDSWYQLKQESGLVNHTYTNDSLYNRLTQDAISYSHNALYQLLQAGEENYSYDLNGNLTKKETASSSVEFTYDALDRLITVTTPQQKVRYTYDSFNRRLRKQVYQAGTLVKEENYLYQGQNEIGSLENDKLTSLRILGIGKGAEIGAAVLLELQGKAYVPLHDHSGNVRCLLDAETNQVAETYRFGAFGEEQLLDSRGVTLSHSLNPWRYASKRYDPETGFLYFGRRYYASSIGRWITQDPLGHTAGPNLYAYVHNSPLFHIDLYGLFAEKGGNQAVSQGVNYQFNSSRSMASVMGAMNPIKHLGRGVEFFNHHVNFEPLTREIIGRGANLLQGKGFVSSRSVAAPVSTFGYEHPRMQQFYVNGINTTQQEAKETASKISAYGGNIRVNTIYNPTRGFPQDFVKASAHKVAGYRCEAVELCYKMLKEATGRARPGEMIIVHAHSDGTTILDLAYRRLPLADQKKIRPIGYGGATVFTRDIYQNNPRSYVSIGDLVAHTDKKGLARGIKDGSVVFVPAGKDFFSHSIDDTYGPSLEWECKNALQTMRPH